MKIALLYVLIALLEIAGCFSVWAWLKLGKSAWWLMPGAVSLAAFAYLLTLIETGNAARTYAAYGGVYMIAALFWLWAVEGVQPTRTDWLGAGLCLLGAVVIVAGARSYANLP